MHEHLLAARVLLGLSDDIEAEVPTEALDAALRDDESYVTTRSDFRQAIEHLMARARDADDHDLTMTVLAAEAAAYAMVVAALEAGWRVGRIES